MHPNEAMKSEPCWLPILLKDGDPLATATAMFLAGKPASSYVDEVASASEAITNNTYTTSVCISIADAITARDAPVTSDPLTRPDGVPAAHVADWKATHPSIRFVMAAPVLVERHARGSRDFVLRPFLPVPIEETHGYCLENWSWSNDYASEKMLYGSLLEWDHDGHPFEPGCLGAAAILVDSGLREVSEGVSRVSRRLHTALIPYEPSNGISAETVRHMVRVGMDPLKAPVNPRVIGAAALAADPLDSVRAQVSAITGDPGSGIPSSSNTDSGSSVIEAKSVLFVETWEDKRGILTVDLGEPHFFHEFIRCPTCNGEVEIKSPRERIPPETECPHCNEGKISWMHRLTAGTPLTGEGNNGEENPE
jgi:hypothetical protein